MNIQTAVNKLKAMASKHKKKGKICELLQACNKTVQLVNSAQMKRSDGLPALTRMHMTSVVQKARPIYSQ